MSSQLTPSPSPSPSSSSYVTLLRNNANAPCTLGVTRKRRESPNDVFLKNFASFIELKKAKLEKEEEKDDQIKKTSSALASRLER